MDRDFLFLSQTEDWSNVGSCLARAIEATGHSALAAASRENPANYPHEDYIYGGQAEAAELIRGSRVVIFMQSQIWNQKWLVHRAPDQMFGVFHGSGNYRHGYKRVNAVFNPHVTFSLVHTHDFLSLGARNVSWLIPPVDIDFIKPRYRAGTGPVVVGHFPSKKGDKKGTSVIRSVVQRVLQGPDNRLLGGKVKFNISEAFVKPWARNINDRVRACDIYVESLCLRHGNRPVGEFGVAALEAAAAGKIVMTVFNGAVRYETVHNHPHQIVKVSTEEELYSKLKYWLLAGNDEIRAKQLATRQWVEAVHSFEAVGRRLLNVVAGVDNNLLSKSPRIWHKEKSTILTEKIGDGTSVAAQVELGDGAVVGRDCKIQAFAYIPGGVTIGDRCFIGQHSMFTNDKYPRAVGEWELRETIVEDDATISAGAIILPGIRIGKNALVGAGAVVTHDVPANEVWVGNPARFLRMREEKNAEDTGASGITEEIEDNEVAVS